VRLFKSQEERAQIAAAENEYAELVRELQSGDPTHVRAVAQSFRDLASSRDVLSETERRSREGRLDLSGTSPNAGPNHTFIDTC
jgi:hypothetical protein